MAQQDLESHQFQSWKLIVDAYAGSYIHGVVRGEAAKSESVKRPSDKMDEVNRNITNLRSGRLTPEMFRVNMIALGYSQRSVEDMLQEFGKWIEQRDTFQPHFGGIKRDNDDDRGKTKERAYICPDHTHEEVMAFMGSAIEHGKMPRTRAHCIKVRREGNG